MRTSKTDERGNAVRLRIRSKLVTSTATRCSEQKRQEQQVRREARYRM